MPGCLDSDLLTFVFVMAEEFGIPPGTWIDIVPRKHLIISRPDSAYGKAAALTRSRFFEEVTFSGRVAQTLPVETKLGAPRARFCTWGF